MSTLDEIGDRDRWRCWLCDEPVDPDASVNADLGPSIDSGAGSAGNGPGKGAGKGKNRSRSSDAGPFGAERLAHRACNTRKGAVAPVVAWPDRLLVADPAPIVATVERLARAGGREVVARCADRGDAQEAADWLVDRIGRLAPDLRVEALVQPGGGQHLLVLRQV